jgi:RNA polymerase sigma-70 factor (ECF subfamily)
MTAVQPNPVAARSLFLYTRHTHSAGVWVDNKDEFWHELDARHRRPLLDYVNSRLRPFLKRSENPGYAEDIVNEAFEAASQKFHSFDSARGALDSWLFAIARNKTYDFLRRNGHLTSEKSIDEIAEPAAPEPEFLYETGAQNSPRTAALRVALKQMTPYDQELLICRLGNRLSYEEIERYFNYSVKRDTLRVHVNRAEARLRKLLCQMPEFADLTEAVYGKR